MGETNKGADIRKTAVFFVYFPFDLSMNLQNLQLWCRTLQTDKC